MKFFLTYWSSITSTLAFCLSLYASIFTWIARYRKPSITIKWIHKIDTQYNLCLSIYNASSRPLVLQRAKLIISGASIYPPVDFPLVLTEITPHHTLKEDNGVIPIAYIDDPSKHFYSSDLPINLDPYKSVKLILPFQFVSEEIESIDPLKCNLNLTFNKDKTITIIINAKKLLITNKEFLRYGKSMIK